MHKGNYIPEYLKSGLIVCESGKVDTVIPCRRYNVQFEYVPLFLDKRCFEERVLGGWVLGLSRPFQPVLLGTVLVLNSSFLCSSVHWISSYYFP